MKPVSWSEPAFFKVQQREYPWPPKYAHVIFGTTTLLFTILPWLYTPKDGLASYLGMPVIGLVIGALGGYWISSNDLKQPAMLSVDRNGVSRMDSMLNFAVPILAMFQYRAHEWSWRQIAEGQLAKCADDRLEFTITLLDKQDVILDRVGVPASVDIDAIKAFFDTNGKPLTEAAV